MSFAIFVVLFVLAAAHSDDALYVCYGIGDCVVAVQYSTVVLIFGLCFGLWVFGSVLCEKK